MHFDVSRLCGSDLGPDMAPVGQTLTQDWQPVHFSWMTRYSIRSLQTTARHRWSFMCSRYSFLK